jgi:hypothetical protein
MDGPQIFVEQFIRTVYPRPGNVGRQSNGRAKRQLGEPGSHLAGVNRLESEASWKRYHRESRHLPRYQQE